MAPRVACGPDNVAVIFYRGEEHRRARRARYCSPRPTRGPMHSGQTAIDATSVWPELGQSIRGKLFDLVRRRLRSLRGGAGIIRRFDLLVRGFFR